MPLEVRGPCSGPLWLLGMALDLIWEALGISWALAGSRTGPGTPQWAGLHSRPGESTVLPGSRDPGDGQSGGRFDGSGPYYQSNSCLIQGTFISELLDLRLRKVTVELLTGQTLRSLVAPSKEGPADIYVNMYIYIYICCC